MNPGEGRFHQSWIVNDGFQKSMFILKQTFYSSFQMNKQLHNHF
jgi:hypothetical protein